MQLTSLQNIKRFVLYRQLKLYLELDSLNIAICQQLQGQSKQEEDQTIFQQTFLSSVITPIQTLFCQHFFLPINFKQLSFTSL